MSSSVLAKKDADLCEAARRLWKMRRLSPREREVVQHVALGRADQVIARRMQVSQRTVRHHVSALFQKLGAMNRVDVAVTGLLAHVSACEECQYMLKTFCGPQRAPDSAA
jgi:DNA-binding NarL/FixJ family response regulator